MTPEQPIRVWKLSELDGPEHRAAQVAALEAERAERVVELKRAIRRRDTAARKAARLTAECMELHDRIWHLRHEVVTVHNPAVISPDDCPPSSEGGR